MTTAICGQHVRTALWALLLGGILASTAEAGYQTLRQRGTWPGYRLGDAQQIAVAGDYAYVAAGGLQIVALQPPSAMRVVGGILNGTDVRQVAVSGNYAAVVDAHGLKLIDISTPTRPLWVGAYTNNAGFNTVALAGQYAYATVSSTGPNSTVQMLDISDPRHIKPANFFTLGQAVSQLKVFGDRLYAQSTTSLSAYDLTDRLRHRLLGQVTHPRTIVAFTLADGYAYLTDAQGLSIVDWSNATQPQARGVWSREAAELAPGLVKAGLQRACSLPGYSVTVADGYAYLGGGANGLLTIDVHDPAKPTLLGVYEAGSDSTYDVAISGDTVLLANGGRGVEAVDASDPGVLKHQAVCLTGGDTRKLAVLDRYVCLPHYTGGMSVVDVSNPDRPRWTGDYASGATYCGVAASSNYVYLPNNGSGLDVLDLRSSGRPALVGRYDSGPESLSPFDVSVAGELACAIVPGSSLHALDLSDPLRPKFVGKRDALFFAQRVTQFGSRAYVSGWADGLQIFELSRTAQPRLLGSWKIEAAVNQVLAQGDYAFAGCDDGLHVLDLSDPAQPRQVGYWSHGLPLNDLVLTGNLIYAASWDGVFAVDISIPTHPRQVALATGFNAWALARVGQSLCVSLREEGLLLLDAYQRPPQLTVQSDAAGCRVTLRAEAGQTVLIQRSEDLQTWTDWQRAIATGEAQSFTDPADPRLPARYYRAVVLSSGESAVHLLQQYPTSLTAEDPRPEYARVWEFSPTDIYQLNSFSLLLGRELAVQTGVADLGIGHCEDGALWAVVIPRSVGTLAGAAAPAIEDVRHYFLRFHPAQIETIFPPETVRANGDASLFDRMSAIARWKLETIWEVDGKATIPRPQDLAVDADTQSGLRRFFQLDTQTQTAQYNASLVSRATPEAPAPELARSAFDQLWQTFDLEYPLFGLRPEVDWARESNRFRARALASASTYEFATVCAEMLRALRDVEVGLTLGTQTLPVYEQPGFLNANPPAIGPLLGGLNSAEAGMSWAVTSEGIGYVAIPQWTYGGLPAAFDTVLNHMLYTRGLIVDVRTSTDGDSALAQKLAARFLDRETVYGYSQVRQGTNHTDLSPRQPRTLSPRGPWRYDRPVRLLMGERCQGAGEAFVAMMSTAPQTVTLGDSTAGANGRPRQLTLPLGLKARVPQSIEYRADGIALSGQGLTPQVTFENTSSAFSGARDDLLTLALNDLRQASWSDSPVTNAPSVQDPPSVVWTYPSLSATNVPREVELRVRFDRPMKPDLFDVTWREGGASQQGTPRYEADKREFVFPVRLMAGTQRIVLNPSSGSPFWIGFQSLADVTAAAYEWTFSTEADPATPTGPKPQLVSVSPTPGSTVSVLTFVELTFDRPLRSPEQEAPYWVTYTSPGVQEPAIVSRVTLDDTGCRMTVPFYALPGKNRHGTLMGLKSSAGAAADSVQLSYNVSTNLFPQDYLARTQAELTNTALLQLVQRMKQARRALTSLEETVQSSLSYRTKGRLQKMTGTGASFKWQKNGAFLADASQPMVSCQHFVVGGDGQQCWWWAQCGDEIDLVAGKSSEIQEQNVAICDPFQFMTDGETQALAEVRPLYLGLQVLDERLCHVLEAWEVDLYGTNTVTVSQTQWWIDADDLRPVEVRTPFNDAEIRYAFRYDNINAPIPAAAFAMPQPAGVQPAPLDNLDASYTRRFLNAMDGSNGRMSVRWGKIGPGGRYSSGLN